MDYSLIRRVSRETPTVWARQLVNGEMCNVLTQELLQQRVETILQKVGDEMKQRQVIISVCTICSFPLGCYDSSRQNGSRKKYCDGCADRCPSPTQPNSHGFCDEHFQGEMTRILLKQTQLGG